MVYVVSDELYHHGIKGQKWGIRRYQNSDGSLTVAGKKRYGVLNDVSAHAKEVSKVANNRAKEDLATHDASVKRYGGEDGWKRYARDAYGTTNGKDYGVSQKEFEKWMKDDLKNRLSDSEKYAKASSESYLAVSKRFNDVVNEINKTPIDKISRKDLKNAKEYMDTYAKVPIDILVDGMYTEEFDKRY